ncbi:PREDICTED: tyrosine--tRNA ligase, mitochondrial-like [Priapulus caudatus]|uniref:Tyrosine--tRNA ligase n=1 Tax=Priapulus caudatus TaxID=37621 RepID=A0ABM1EK25_PRICU|nr:PREDICTED: tyrosine--tRNA ligase, mitochondrial-like [Priapulus caudatus]
MAAPMKHVEAMLRSFRLCKTKRLLTCSRPRIKMARQYSKRNVLELHERGLFQDIFPDANRKALVDTLNSGSQCIYCGFDPTADSLHIGNLLALIALIHCSRSGHSPIVVLGGATAQIGDPSGKTHERDAMTIDTIDTNVMRIHSTIERIFTNHQQHLYHSEKELPSVRIMDNRNWYKTINLVDFLASTGRNFRMGQMLGKQSVETRLQSPDGMSFTEFTYQVFQAYDWLHLYREHNCLLQIGGNDQMGNMKAGYDLISRITNNTVYGLTVPLVLTTSGDKLGKTAGNAVWLDPDRTSAFEFYQYFLRLPDSEIEKYLMLFTFLPTNEVQDVLRKHWEKPEGRHGQKTIAREVTKLVHGDTGLWSALPLVGAFVSVRRPLVTLSLDPGVTVLDLAMKARCFSREVDAKRIIGAGGFYINYQRVTSPEYVLIQGQHILPNNTTLVRVGKKNYYVVRWVNM